MQPSVLLALFLVAGAMPRTPASPAPSGAVADTHAVWAQVTGYITQAAKDVPEADYGFRPTPEVRTFGQLIGHLAGAQNLMCAAALGEKGGAEDDVEKSKTTKADLVSALEASNAYCARAYAQADADATGATKLFGKEMTRFRALVMNATHDNEHYGNIVTYMRIKGMVPPSSRPAAGR